MLLFNLSSNKGADKEQAENGTTDAFGLSADGVPVKLWIKPK
jgi:hypothetical protein